MACVAASVAQAQEATSAAQTARADAAAVARGEQAFGVQCAFCHGANARGGAQGGSDLLLSPIVLEDERGSHLGPFLKVGRPEKNMPRFDLTPRQVADLAAFLRARMAAASSRTSAVSILVGDATAGAAYFNGRGRCTTCHSVDGDLKGVAKKYEPRALQGRMVVPRGDGGWPTPGSHPGDKGLRATVTPASGASVSGAVVYLSDFYITVNDAAGQRHTFVRRGDEPKVTLVDPLQAHLELLRTLTDRDMHNLTAYLATLK